MIRNSTTRVSEMTMLEQRARARWRSDL